MNRIRIWCPHCREFESVLPNHNTWVTKKCRSLLKDRESMEVLGPEGLNRVLISGIWIVNRKTRMPPKIKVKDGK